MTPERVDLAVLGGGCAGLSLATRLADAGLAGRRLLVLEGRERYENDRTWCSWTVEPHRFDACVTHRWNRWSVTRGGETTVQSSTEVAYEHLPADRFYAEARRAIEAADGAELRLGTAVRGVADDGRSVVVETSRGTVEADLVVDTRPPPAPPPGALLQHFGGWHVRAGERVFDPTTVTLMDFDVPQDLGTHFVYVLPFSEREALVEPTWFTPRTLPRAVYDGRVRAYLARRYGLADVEVLRREYGVVPMASVPRPAETPRLVHLGAVAGATKPSTGYAFLNIQRAAAALARDLAAEPLGHDRPRTRAPRSRTSELLDRVFLRFLADQPGRAPDAFARMFRSVAPESVARFLMERARPMDQLAVVAAMPKLPFVRAALAGGSGR